MTLRREPISGVSTGFLTTARTLSDLEFEKVKALVAEHATSALGREYLDRLQPTADRSHIETQLNQVEELKQLFDVEVFVMESVEDLHPILEQTDEIGTLAAEDLWKILGTLESTRRMKERIRHLEGDYPQLRKLVGRIKTFPELETALRGAIDEEGQVKDDASARLSRMTNERRTVAGRVQKRLQGMLSSPRYADIIAESVITRRAGRLVIPIKSNARGALDCVIQDSSNSGRTLYVEPAAVVEENNRIRELEVEIRKERLRILRELTASVRVERGAIEATLEAVGWFDSVYARARYAIARNCHRPRLNEAGDVHLIQARHPLLYVEKGEVEVVPIEISFGRDHQGIVLTGPNTGGKTVALKTIGLLTLMVQAGFQIPAATESRIAIFPKVFSDIGDEQSIEQNLSTFSSHMTNIVEILSQVDRDSLVLVDEIGAGTDPQEGVALGMGILQHLLRSGARIAVTTHFSPLKRFSYKHPLLKNASVDFDLNTLSPTYRILEGIPGSSNALIIAERLGLSEGIIVAAKGFLSGGEVKSEDIIRDLQNEQRELERLHRELKVELQEARAARERYEQELERMRAEEERALDDELKHLRTFLKEAQATIEAALARMKEQEAHVENLERIREQHRRLRVVEEELEARQRQLRERQERETAVLDLGDLQEEDRVFVRSVKKVGVVERILDKDRIEVRIDGLRITTRLSDLRWPPPEVHRPQERPERPDYKLVRSSEMVGLELNVREMTISDALREVDRYLDRLLISDIPQAYILHGKGTGTLRRAIRDYLNTHPYVKGYGSAPPNEGGDGVTVVELDETPENLTPE